MKVATKRISVTVPARKVDLQVFELYAENYDVPLNRLLQCEAFAQADSFLDDPLTSLEWMDELTESTETREVTLEFCPLAHALLSRVAELLRRPMPELLQGLLAEGGDMLKRNTEDALREPEGLFSEDMESWANEAIKFERLAARDKVPNNRGDTAGGWETFGLRQPEKRAASLALNGGVK